MLLKAVEGKVLWVLLLLLVGGGLLIANISDQDDTVKCFYAKKVTRMPSLNQMFKEILSDPDNTAKKYGESLDPETERMRNEIEKQIGSLMSDLEKAQNEIVYFSSDKIRTDSGETKLIGQISTIFLKKKEKIIMISHDRKAYAEMDLGETWPGIADEDEAQKTDLGVEEINGYKCTKYAVSRNVDIMGKKMEVKLFSWESERFPMPLKTESAFGITQELNEIKEVEVSAKLFEVPRRYRKVKDFTEFFLKDMIMPGLNKLKP